MIQSNAVNLIKDKQKLHSYKLDQLDQAMNKKKELESLASKIDISKVKLDNLVYTCKLILEKITYASKYKLENFLTKAFKNIFLDRDYEIQLVLKEGTKKAGLELTLIENGVGQEVTDAVGGGIISTLGLLLQIYYIETFNLNKIMLIDEGLKEISTGVNSSGETVNYLENLLRFLQWLADERQYALVIITHDNTVKKFANKVYTVEKGKVMLCQV